MADAKIKFTAEDATGAAFAAVTRNVANLKSELTLLPAKFAQVAIAAAGVGSIAGFASMISDSIEAKVRLRDLSIQTNITVEALASLQRVGRYSSTGIEDIAAGSNKLSKALFTQNEDSKGAAAAIAALGLSFNEFKNLSPDQQMLTVAKALNEFQDGSEKSATAMLLFGKNGATLLPFLKELAERGLEVTKETAAQAKAAKEYEDNLTALKIAGDQWKKTLVNDMLPALVDFSRELLAGREAYGGWFAALFGVGLSNPFNTLEENAQKARKEVADLEQALTAARSGAILPGAADDPTGARAGSSPAEIEAALDAARKRRDYFDRLQRFKGSDATAPGTGDFSRLDRKPKLKIGGGDTKDADADARALLKKQFEGQLKLIKDFAEQQKDGYAFANEYLKGVYEDGVTSLADFFEKQHAIRDQALAAQLSAFDQEIAAAQDYKAKAVKPQDREEADNRIKDATEKRAAAVQKASQADILANQQEAKSASQLAQAYQDFLANVLALRGDAAGADAIRTAKEVQAATEQLTKSLGPEKAKEQAASYGELLTQTRALGRAQADYSRLVEEAKIKEDNVALDAQASGASELDTLIRITAIRKDAIAALAEQAQGARDYAAAVGSKDALLAAQKITLQLRQAMAEAEPLFVRIREIGKEAGDAVANDAEQAILHWQGLRSVLSAVEQDILRILLRSQVTKPFGDYLGNLIGGNGQSSGGGGLLGKILPGLFGGGAQAAFSQTALGSSGFGTGLAYGNADFGGFFADGGTLQPGQWGIAGENGPERIYAGAEPVHVMANQGRTLHVTVNQSFAPGTNTKTINQAAVEMAGVIARAQRRGLS